MKTAQKNKDNDNAEMHVRAEKVENVVSLVTGSLMVLSFLRHGRGIGKLVTGGLLVHRGLTGVYPPYKELVERVADRLLKPANAEQETEELAAE